MEKRRDIIFLCQFFYPEYVSSATLPFETATALSDNGYKIGALCGYPKEYNLQEKVPSKENVNGIIINRLKYIELNRKGFLGRLINYFSFTFVALLNVRRCKEYRAVIVYSNPPILSWVASIAKKKYGCKLLYVVYDIYPELAIATKSISEDGIISKMMKRINKKVYSNADEIITLSSEMKTFLETNRNIRNKSVTVIPNWYEDVFSKCYSPEITELFKEYKGKFVVSYLGNMGICQDMETIMECCKLLKDSDDIYFLIAGHGNKYDYVNNYINDNKLKNVKLKSFLHNEYYLAALSISSVSIISLEKGTTGLCCPSKAYGYLMAGNPVAILMDESDLTNQARDYPFGFVVPNGKPDILATGIKNLVENPELQSLLSRGARKAFKEKYTREICVKQYIDIMNKVIG